jgi:hypothetical protein
LAGGVNLYSYADGNPVAFSDPFGLASEDCKTRPAECLLRRTVQGAALGASAVATASVAGSPLTLGTSVAAAPLTVPAGAALGGLVGFSVGAAEIASDNIAASRIGEKVRQAGEAVRRWGQRILVIIGTIGTDGELQEELIRRERERRQQEQLEREREKDPGEGPNPKPQE